VDLSSGLFKFDHLPYILLFHKLKTWWWLGLPQQLLWSRNFELVIAKFLIANIVIMKFIIASLKTTKVVKVKFVITKFVTSKFVITVLLSSFRLLQTDQIIFVVTYNLAHTFSADCALGMSNECNDLTIWCSCPTVTTGEKFNSKTK